MKKFIDKLKNIWSIDELRKRILYTITLVLVYRIGCYVALPGINPSRLNDNTANGGGGLLGIINMFAGGAFSRASIFALGVMPYISASIFMQLAGIVIPQVAKMQKEDSGRRKINSYTRYLTVIVTMFQAGAYVAYLRSPSYAQALAPDFGNWFPITTMIVLTAGTLFVMWLGEKITDRGIGNGTSLIIMVGILARFPSAIVQEFSKQECYRRWWFADIPLLRSLYSSQLLLGLFCLHKVCVKYRSTMPVVSLAALMPLKMLPVHAILFR